MKKKSLKKLKKKYKNIKKYIQNGFIRRFKKVTFLNFMIPIIYKISVLIKNHLNYLKDKIFECFF